MSVTSFIYLCWADLLLTAVLVVGAVGISPPLVGTSDLITDILVVVVFVVPRSSFTHLEVIALLSKLLFSFACVGELLHDIEVDNSVVLSAAVVVNERSTRQRLPCAG